MQEGTNEKSATRRTFLKSAATAAVFVPNPGLGKKGKTYPDQRRKYRDSRTGRTVWQMTDTPGRTTVAQYATQSMTTPDGRWLIYGSDRASERGQLNLFKMDLRTGISTQLTESNRNLTYRWSHISPGGKEVYFVEDKDLFRIGLGCRHVARRDADLYAFANDLMSKYGNNSGELRVNVTRVS